MISSKWEQRIRRADELAAELPFAAEVLRFYGRVARLQKEIYEIARPEEEITGLLRRFPDFLRTVWEAAPEPLANCARDLAQLSAPEWLDLLQCFRREAASFQPAPGKAADLLACLFLQPYAERQAEDREAAPGETFGVCPFCRSRPIAGALRPEGDGGKRSLICAFCATEWNIGRIVCPACGEENVDRLAVYSAKQFAHVRVEACDTCRYYIKTVDLTKNGRAVPVVDELAAIPLDLWAQQRGYTKLRGNLVGM